jgi:hypothetical protein
MSGEYKERFEKILGDAPKNLWSALIPQILTWSFRRFFLITLQTSDITGIAVSTEIWSDFLELIDRFAPDALKKETSLWLSPEVLQIVPLALDELDFFLKELVVDFDRAVETSNDNGIQELATFLDEDVPNALRNWLGETYNAVYFFPLSSEEEDDFTQEQRDSLSRAAGELVLFGHLYHSGEPLPIEVPDPNVVVMSPPTPVVQSSPPTASIFPKRFQSWARLIGGRTLRTNQKRSITPVRGFGLQTRRVRFQTPLADSK